MADPSPGRMTEVLRAIAAGDARAAEEFLPLVYDELHRLARRQMAHEEKGHTLQPTALVHEVWLRIAGEGEMRFENRAHFFGAAAQAMRRILIERARRAGRQKRGGDRERLTLDDVEIAAEERSDDLLALEEALTKLEKRDARKCRIVMLRFFAGLSIEETAAALGLSRTTVKDEWAFARAWLHDEMRGEMRGTS